jgi:hypothetical protein
MPAFKSTYNILTKQDEDEVFNHNWMDSDKVVTPPRVEWDYSRELTIDDIDIWEVLHEQGGGWGVYAAWCPYAEFYLITTGLDARNDPKFFGLHMYHGREFETYYGPGSQNKVYKRAKELGINLQIYQNYVDKDRVWLFQPDQQQNNKIISFR